MASISASIWRASAAPREWPSVSIFPVSIQAPAPPSSAMGVSPASGIAMPCRTMRARSRAAVAGLPAPATAGQKSSALAAPAQAAWAGEASGFAVAVTVGIGAMRCPSRTRTPRASSRSPSMAPRSKRSPSAKRMQTPGSASTPLVNAPGSGCPAESRLWKRRAARSSHGSYSARTTLVTRPCPAPGLGQASASIAARSQRHPCVA